MLLGRRVRVVGEALVVEIVNEARRSPPFLILAEFGGIGAHGALDGQHVLAQRVTRRVLVHQREGLLAGRDVVAHGQYL